MFYATNDRVKVWWRGEETTGRITEKLPHRDVYRVTLKTGEVCLRMASDLEPNRNLHSK